MLSQNSPLSIDNAAAADDTLGGRIVQAREAAGLSSKDVAARLGVAVRTVANWERDRAEPRSNKLSMLAGLLSVSPTWLLAGAGTAPREAAADGGSTELQGEIDRIKTDAARLIQRLDTLGEQLAATGERGAE